MEVVKGPDGSREEWINRMIAAHEKELLRLCCACLRDAALAEDAVQETFVRAYRNMKAFRGESGEKTWLYRIAINVCRDMRRRDAWLRIVDGAANLDALSVAAPEPGGESALYQGVLGLPRKYREVVLLYYYEDMKLTDVAEALGISGASVSRRLKKARALLKELLEGSDGFEN